MAEELMRPERLQIMLNPEELKAVDDFRFQSRMPSRAAAVRELLKRGLAAEGFEIAVPGMKSQSFGVLGSSASVRKAAAASGGTSGGPTEISDVAALPCHGIATAPLADTKGQIVAQPVYGPEMHDY